MRLKLRTRSSIYTRHHEDGAGDRAGEGLTGFALKRMRAPSIRGAVRTEEM